MKKYIAPLEGITGFVYRNALEKYYGEKIDKYFAPFIVPRPKKGMQNSERRDLLPENNQTLELVPQILTNQADAFCSLAHRIHAEFGYNEINLNLGCPSGTVVSGGKGAGFLAKTEELNRFLENIFKQAEVKISIKTRLGILDEDEFDRVLAIYNQYPISELIIHPRVQKDMYRKAVHMEAFCRALENCKMPVCYNGDIYTAADYQEKLSKIQEVLDGEEKVIAVMYGRGIIGNPSLVQQIEGGKMTDKKTLQQFHDTILNGYEKIMDSDNATLFRMKELWMYMHHLFQAPEKPMKMIKKSQNLSTYHLAVAELFRHELQES